MKENVKSILIRSEYITSEYNERIKAYLYKVTDGDNGFYIMTKEEIIKDDDFPDFITIPDTQANRKLQDIYYDYYFPALYVPVCIISEQTENNYFYTLHFNYDPENNEMYDEFFGFRIKITVEELKDYHNIVEVIEKSNIENLFVKEGLIILKDQGKCGKYKKLNDKIIKKENVTYQDGSIHEITLMESSTNEGTYENLPLDTDYIIYYIVDENNNILGDKFDMAMEISFFFESSKPEEIDLQKLYDNTLWN